MTESIAAPPLPNEPTSIPELKHNPALRAPLRLLVPTLMLIAYWVVTEGSYRLEMGMFYRFVTRTVTLLVTLLFFLGWGFTRRHFRFRERCLAFAMIVGCLIVAGSLRDPKTGPEVIPMLGLPIVFTLSVLWLWGTRGRSVASELSGIGFSSAIVFGVFALLRWDGMDGRQRPELSWRWKPSATQQFEAQIVAAPSINHVVERRTLNETAEDWNSFRGGDREGVVLGIQLGDWSTHPPKEAWRHRVGPAWSSVIAIGDLLFTQEQRGNLESVVCYKADSGEQVWTHSRKELPGKFNDSLSGAGPRATPTFHDNRIYAYGAKGRLECLDASTGECHWSHNLFEMTKASVPQWGSSTSPTIVDDKVVVFTGGKDGNSLLAFDRLTGERRWQTAGGTVSYSSPQVVTLDGERQLLMHDDKGLNAVRIDDGTILWRHASPHEASFQPMLQSHRLPGDRLLVNWDAGLLCLEVRRVDDKWQTNEIWKSNRLKPSFNEFAIHEQHIYGLDDGILCCVDLEQGRRKWKGGRYGFGQLLLLPEINELLVITEQGELVRVAADPKEHREIATFKAIEGKTWNHPILVNGRLIARNSEEMACFDLSKAAGAKNEDN